MNRYICIHGHFYQPPRENPWLEAVELQDSSYPYHDWNTRVTAECYAPNSASRILDAEKRIVDIVNNYAKISFNFGPTLLAWIERHEPEIHAAIIDADRASRERFGGHGGALAQAYNHMIMPLANARDKRTQIIWGIRDFERRFGRRPEGMWLPETAVDRETLDIMAEHSIAFTLLAPRQARRIRKIGEKAWQDAREERIDPKLPYLCRLPSGKTMSLFFYDGPVAREVAFGGLLESGENFARRLAGTFADRKEDQLVHIATDGESYGHHRRHGDMALAYCLHKIESDKLAAITVYGEYLEKHPPVHEVEIFENSSWSCIHGVERWKSDCGCDTGANPAWNQAWRVSLRAAMDWLRDGLDPVYEQKASELVRDPWAARDDYIGVMLDRSPENVERFFSEHRTRELSPDEKVTVLKLLEMERHQMFMYTSCGWFFDDISGIETVQILSYAARAIQLARETAGVDFEPQFLKILEKGSSNIREFKNGAAVYELFVRPAVLDLMGVGAHYAISSLFEEYPETSRIYCYSVSREEYERVEMGRQKIAVGTAKIRSQTTFDESTISFAVLHLGDHNFVGGGKPYGPGEPWDRTEGQIKEAFLKSDLSKVIVLMDRYFGSHDFSLWHLFKDEQREIMRQIMEPTLKDLEFSYRQIYEDNCPVMQAMDGLRIPLPRILATAVEFILNSDLVRLLETDGIDRKGLEKTVNEMRRWSVSVDKPTVSFVGSAKIVGLMTKVEGRPEDVSLLEEIDTLFGLLSPLPVGFDLWKVQNTYFSLGKDMYAQMRGRAGAGDHEAERWVEAFERLGQHLKERAI
jgi:alpha-amylase/alpha-mannosidase (GH57 family)